MHPEERKEKPKEAKEAVKVEMKGAFIKKRSLPVQECWLSVRALTSETQTMNNMVH